MWIDYKFMITTGNHPSSAVENQVNDCNYYICEKNLLTLERWDAKSFVWCDKLQATKPVFLSFSLSVTSFFYYSYQDLQDQYLSLQTYADDLRREVKSLEKHVDDLTKRHREELKAQVSLYLKDMFCT